MKFKVGDKVVRINVNNDREFMKIGTIWEVEGYRYQYLRLKGYLVGGGNCNENNFRLATPLEQLL
jgi:hypothetical protein